MGTVKVIFQIFLFLLIMGCKENKKPTAVNNKMANASDKFSPQNREEKSYDLNYFSGQAEVSTYELRRARYEDKHPGEAVLIFVSEPFLFKKQVKSDKGRTNETVKVLKMNRIDRFTTGIYDYSMFTSVFTPLERFSIDYPLKVTFSSQDWCGQAFAQLNNSQGFKYSQYSYFESESDTIFDLSYNLSEDNIFNIIRIDSDQLPIGEFKILPAQSYVRTAHIDYKAYKAIASFGRRDSLLIYNYEIPELRRSVRVTIDEEDYNKIIRWTETYPTIFDGKLRTSEYELISSRNTPYWKLNDARDVNFRDSLELGRP